MFVSQCGSFTSHYLRIHELTGASATKSAEWEIELEVPDNRIGFVKHAQAESGDQPLEVVFRLASDSKKNYRGTLKRLDYRSDERADTEKSVVLVYVDINESELGDALRLGTRVHGKICCGDRNNFFLFDYNDEL